VRAVDKLQRCAVRIAEIEARPIDDSTAPVLSSRNISTAQTGRASERIIHLRVAANSNVYRSGEPINGMQFSRVAMPPPPIAGPLGLKETKVKRNYKRQ
jgi:hypothetical protein